MATSVAHSVQAPRTTRCRASSHSKNWFAALADSPAAVVDSRKHLKLQSLRLRTRRSITLNPECINAETQFAFNANGYEHSVCFLTKQLFVTNSSKVPSHKK